MPNCRASDEKCKIAQAFNRAAMSYADAARLQRTVGHQLLGQANGYLNNPTVLVDMGSGDSYFSQVLANTLPATTIISLDIAYAMLNHNLTQTQCLNIKHICADFDYLPVSDRSIDMVFSNMSMQWSLDFQYTLAETYRILRPGGVLLLAMPSQGTLIELTMSMKAIDPHCQVNHFPAAASIECTLHQVGFSPCSKQQQKIQYCYYQFTNILHDLKATGTNYTKFNSSNAKFSKRYLTRLAQAYEKYRNQHGKLPVNYEIAYFVVKKPA